jgi:argininosuccinate lyase
MSEDHPFPKRNRSLKNETETAERASRNEVTGVRKGRFATPMDPGFARFNSSVAFDQRLYAQDIQGSIAHVRMLAQQGVVSEDEAVTIQRGLKEVLADIEAGQFVFSDELEDVHINIESALREKIGDVAGKLHTARSRNDQVALDLRLYVRDESRTISLILARLLHRIVDKADQTVDIILPGYTHLQRAQPVRLAHHLMAYYEMFRRDWERIVDAVKRLNVMPLGSAALAGTTFSIDRERTADEMGFDQVCRNSMDGVSDRDFAVEFVFICALIMMHLSRLAEELILWSSAEFDYCTLPDEFCSGSSIMPQKKNPDACELIRGKTGRVYGGLLGLLTTLKALPLTYNKDLQEDKEPVFDAADTVRGSLDMMCGMIPGIVFNEQAMQRAASAPELAATDLAERLAQAGVPFREAHERIGAIIRQAQDGEEEVPDPAEMVEARDHTGGTSKARVMEQIDGARAFLAGLTVER